MQVTDFFEKIKKLRVMVIGDVMIDRYVSGRVGRISPEAPVPIVEQAATEDRLGGAANVALNVVALGARPITCGLIGQDTDSAAFFSLLKENGLSPLGILTSAERVTTVKTRIIAEHQHLLRLDKEDKNDLSENETQAFLKLIGNQLDAEKPDVIILQDYNKGVLSGQVIRGVLAEAKKRRIPVAVDPKFHNFWTYEGVALFKPNLREIQDALKKNVKPDMASLQSAAHALREKLGQQKTLITLSEHGVFYDENGKSAILPARPRQVADVCGAGDAVISIAAIGLALGLNMEKIAELSNLVGGQVVERLGVVPIDPAQLELEIKNGE